MAQAETIILVHGTFAGSLGLRTQWWEPNSKFCRALDKRLSELGSSARCWAHVRDRTRYESDFEVRMSTALGNPNEPGVDRPLYVYDWSGENSWIARANAASMLAKHISVLVKKGWRCHVIAHSHGGNVLIDALNSIGLYGFGARDWSDGNLVTIGTPFLESHESTRARHRYGGEIFLSVIITTACAWPALTLLKLSLPTSWISWAVAAAATAGFLVIGYTLALAWGLAVGTSRYQSEYDRLLVISSENDEAYQLLSKIFSIKNPFLRETEGASFEALLEWFYAFVAIARRTDHLRFPAPFQGIPFSLVTLFCVLLVGYQYGPSITQGAIGALALISLGGLAVYFFFSPDSARAVVCLPSRLLRFVVDGAKALALRATTWILRRSVWQFLRNHALGASEYPFQLRVKQTPDVSEVFYRFVALPERAVKEALERREQGVRTTHAVLSEVLARPQLSSADFDNILRHVERDVTLVHAAYYSDPECLDEIAAWIARTEEEVRESGRARGRLF